MDELKPQIMSTQKLNPKELANILIQRIMPNSNFDKNAFKQYRDFYFTLTSQDFDQISTVQFINLINYFFQAINMNIPAYVTELLKTLVYLDFRLTNNTTLDKFLIFAAQIGKCSIEDLNYYIRIIRNTFELHFQDLDKNHFAFASTKLFAVIKMRFHQMIERFKTLKEDEYVTVLSLMEATILFVKTVDRLNEIYTEFYTIFKEIIDYDIPEDISYTHKVTILNLKVKCLLILSNQSLERSIQPQDRQHIFEKCLELIKMSPTIPFLVVDYACISAYNLMKQSQFPLGELGPKYLLLMLNFKYYSEDNFNAFKSITRRILETLNSHRLYSKELMIHLSKFAVGALHFSEIPSFMHSINVLNAIIPFVKPQRDERVAQLSSALFALFFSTIDTAIVEITTKVQKVKPFLIKQNGSNAMKQHQLLEYVSVFIKLLRFLEIFIAQLFPQQDKLKMSLAKSLTINLDLVHIDNVYSCYRHALIFIMEFRTIFQVVDITDKVCDTTFKQNVYMERSTDDMMKIRKQHSQATKALLKCMFFVPSIMIGNIWDYFLQDFFSHKEHIQFDMFLLRTILQNANTLGSFIRSLVFYLFKAFNKGYNITHIIRSLYEILENTIRKPMNVVRTPEFCSEITNDMELLIPVFIEYTKSPIHCADILGLIRVFCQFIDFIVGKTIMFSHKVFNDSFVNKTCTNADSVNVSPNAICTYIKFALDTNPELVKLKIILTCLINAMKTSFNEPFELIESKYRKRKEFITRHSSAPQLYLILMNNLNTPNKALKARIIKMLKHLPNNIIDEAVQKVDVYSWKNLIFKTEKQTIRMEFEKFIQGVNRALFEYSSVDKIWEIARILASSVLDNGVWTSENRKYFHSILACLFPIKNKNEEMFLSVFTEIINEYRENILVLAHLFCANYSYFENPPRDIIEPILAAITTKELMTAFIKEISLISDLHIFPHKNVNITICKVFTTEIKKELIDPVTFAIFVHRIVLDIYSSEWLKKQKCDGKTNFIELDFVLRAMQDVIVFARDLLKDSDQSILPILHNLKDSSAFFSILVQNELISECKYNKEVHDFIEECFNDEVLNHDFDLYRFLGPLFRAFPDALDDFMDQTRELVNSKVSTLSSFTDKQQGTFIVLLVPVLQNEKFGFENYDEIIPIILHFLDFPNNFLKCQAQLVAKTIAEKGPPKAQAVIKNFCTNKMKNANILTFEQSTNKLTSINWKLLNSTLFSCYLIFPRQFISVFIKQLNSLKSAIEVTGQNQSRRELIPYLHSLCSFIATGSVVKQLVEADLFQQVAELFAFMFFTISLLPRSKFVSVMVDFFGFAPEHFVKYVKSSLSNVNIKFITIILDHPISYPLFRSVEDELLPSIIEALKSKEKKETVCNSLIANIAIVFDSAKTNEELIDLIYQAMMNLINTFDKFIVLFYPHIFDRLLEFFRVNHIKRFIQIAFKIFEVNNPLLITKYAQQYAYIINEKNLTNEIFYSIDFSSDNDINTQFLETLIIPYLQRNNNMIEDTLKFIKEKFGLYTLVVIIIKLIKEHVTFDYSMFKPYELYKEAEDDRTRTRIFVYWAFSNSTENFMELFQELVKHFHISVVRDVKVTINKLKIPEDTSEEDLDKILALIVKMMDDFNKHTDIICHLYKFLINNASVFKRPLTELLHDQIQTHAIHLYLVQKKDIYNNINLAVELANIISITPDEKHHYLANHICYIFTKFFEQYDINKQFNQEISKYIPIVFTKLPPNSPLIGEFLAIFINIHKKFENDEKRLIAMQQQLPHLQQGQPPHLQPGQQPPQHPQPGQQQPHPPQQMAVRPPPPQLAPQQPPNINQQLQKVIAQQQLQKKVQQLQKAGQHITPQQINKMQPQPQPQRQVTLPQQQMIVNYEKYLIDMLIPVLPSITDYLSKYPNFPQIDVILDFLVKNTLSGTHWSQTVQALTVLVEGRLYAPKVLSLIGIPTEEVQLARVFRLLWLHPPQKNLRTQVLLPFALKFCTKVTQGRAYPYFEADAVMLCILENPFEGSLSVVIRTAEAHVETIRKEESFSFIVRFLTQGFLMKDPPPYFTEILINFMRIPIVASLFFQRGTNIAIEKAAERLPLIIKLINIFRLSPSLDEKAEEIINKVSSDELLTLCKKESIYSVPFAYFASQFFNISAIDMLKVVKYVSPSCIAKTINHTLIDSSCQEHNIEFKFGPCNISDDFNITSWEKSFSNISNDFDYSKAEVEFYPALRKMLGYEVNVDEMAGFVPKISYNGAKSILDNTYHICEAAISFLKDLKSTDFDDHIKQFFVEVMNNVTTKNYKEFLIANEISKIRKIRKVRNENIVFFDFKLTPNDKPALHKAYKEVRQLIRDSLPSYTKIVALDESIHESIFRESIKLHSTSINRESASDLIKENAKNAEALLCHLFSLNNEIEPSSVLFDALTMALRTSRSDAVFSILAMLVNDLDDKNLSIITNTIKKLPAKWAIFFASKICKNPKLRQMISLLPYSCNAILIENGIEIGVDVKRQVNTFLNPIKRLISTERVQRIKKTVELEKRIYAKKGKLTKKELNSMEAKLNELNDFDEEGLALGQYSVAPIPPPLTTNEEFGQATALSIFLQSKEERFVSLQLLTTSGAKIPYSITCGKPMQRKIAMFSKCVTDIFQKSPGSYKRDLRLLGIEYFKLSDDFYLSQTNAIPYVEYSVLQSMLDAIQDKEKKPETNRIQKAFHDFITFKDFYGFVSFLGSNYGALCLIQAAFHSSCPSPFDMSTDINNALISISQFERSEEETIFRLFGRISSFFDEATIKGKFRTGIISAADAFANNETKTKVLLRALLKCEHEEGESIIQTAESFSTYSENIEEMQNMINSLIESSIECDDPTYIPWI